MTRIDFSEHDEPLNFPHKKVSLDSVAFFSNNNSNNCGQIHYNSLKQPMGLLVYDDFHATVDLVSKHVFVVGLCCPFIIGVIVESSLEPKSTQNENECSIIINGL
jgi:hypothetical protein